MTAPTPPERTDRADLADRLGELLASVEERIAREDAAAGRRSA